MSGAQPKAATIDGCIAVIAEVDRRALEKRHAQGWVQEVVHTAHECLDRIRQAKKEERTTSIAFLGNVVTLWEALCSAPDGHLLVDLGSDQTSLHNPFNGGYYPVQLSFDEANVVGEFATPLWDSLSLSLSNSLSVHALHSLHLF
jgi:urocanate hydratase